MAMLLVLYSLKLHNPKRGAIKTNFTTVVFLYPAFQRLGLGDYEMLACMRVCVWVHVCVCYIFTKPSYLIHL